MDRLLRFNAVGVAGFAVQIAMLWLLARSGVHYLAATAIAVEAAILHNFAWHERWTWRDRTPGCGGRLARLLRFHAVNGAVSLGGNLLLMPVLVRGAGLPVLTANLVAVIVCAAINFAGADRLVFSRQPLAISPAARSVTATKVSVPLVHPAVGSVADPATNRLS